jgi:hypothetical protein
MSKINKDEFLKYRIDILESKIINLEKRLDSVVPSNNNNNIELLQMVVSMAKEPKNKEVNKSKQDDETSNTFSFIQMIDVGFYSITVLVILMYTVLFTVKSLTDKVT